MSTGFKETKIGQIPTQWSLLSLGDIAKFSQGVQVDVSNQKKCPKKGYIRFIRIVDYTQDTDDIRYIEYPGDKYCVEKDDIVMVRYGSPGFIGRGISGAIANNMFRIIPNNENNEIMTNDYLCYFLSQNRIQQTLIQGSGSSTMAAINFGFLRKLAVVVPPLPEQHKIAEILSTVDETIERTDAIIRETQQLKKGLMQKLFVNKAFMVLRKAKEEETDLKPIAIHELGEIVTGTTPSTTVREYYDNPEYMFIGPADIGQSKRIVKSANYISKEGFAVSRQLPYDAVMVVGIGATIGKVGITSEPCTTNQQINAIIPNTREFPADYVCYLLAGISDYVLTFAGQTATPIMNKGEFGKMLTFIHPTLEERQKIAEILSEVDAKIETEQVFKAELEQLKKGLMQVLLTGKIRVKV